MSNQTMLLLIAALGVGYVVTTRRASAAPAPAPGVGGGATTGQNFVPANPSPPAGLREQQRAPSRRQIITAGVLGALGGALQGAVSGSSAARQQQ